MSINRSTSMCRRPSRFHRFHRIGWNIRNGYRVFTEFSAGERRAGPPPPPPPRASASLNWVGKCSTWSVGNSGRRIPRRECARGGGATSLSASASNAFGAERDVGAVQRKHERSFSSLSFPKAKKTKQTKTKQNKKQTKIFPLFLSFFLIVPPSWFDFLLIFLQVLPSFTVSDNSGLRTQSTIVVYWVLPSFFSRFCPTARVFHKIRCNFQVGVLGEWMEEQKKKKCRGTSAGARGFGVGPFQK